MLNIIYIYVCVCYVCIFAYACDIGCTRYFSQMTCWWPLMHILPSVVSAAKCGWLLVRSFGHIWGALLLIFGQWIQSLEVAALADLAHSDSPMNPVFRGLKCLPAFFIMETSIICRYLDLGKAMDFHSSLPLRGFLPFDHWSQFTFGFLSKYCWTPTPKTHKKINYMYL